MTLHLTQFLLQRAGDAAVCSLALLACGGAEKAEPSVSAPDVRLLSGDGAGVALSQLTDATTESSLLVVRVVTGWCGTCRWSASHTQELVPAELAGQVQIVDVLVTGDENAPATERDIAVWQARSDGGARVLADPSFQLRGLFPEQAPLPWIALVDPGTRHVLGTLANPAPEQLRAALADALHSGSAGALTLERSDGRFTRDEWDLIRDMVLDGRPAPDPSNAVADEPGAAALGRSLFASGALSPRGTSCASCHWPGLLFQDGRETPSEGGHRLDRNAPTTLLAGFSDTQLWDGRADSQWMQALLPIESAVEFGSSRLFAVHALDQQHREEYEALFGPLPVLTDTNRFPPSGGPGDPAWDALPEADRFEVTRAFVNIGKSLAAFERSQQPLPNVLDQYGSGTLDALDDEQKDGLATFFDAGCAQCHYGPLLTDGAFHNLRFPSGRRDRMGDRGRLDGLVQLRESEFRRSGPFSDAPGAFAAPDSFPAALGAFKTPGLRGVGYSLPYGHGGSYWGLTSVLEAHRVGGLPAESPYAVGDVEPFLPAFDAALVPKIMKFLVALRLDVETGIEGAP